MNLRVRLIVVFFLLSVVPLGVVTFYSYTNSAAAIREAAGLETESLAGELTGRMQLVTAQLSLEFERLMNIPAATTVATNQGARQTASAQTPGIAAPAQPPATATATRRASPDGTASANTDGSKRAAEQLGEVAMLLNTIDVRGFGRGRGGSPRNGSRANAPPDNGGASGDRPSRSDANPDHLEIDLRAVRRGILRQLYPDREQFDQLSEEERRVVLARVNERMLGIQQGIQLLREKATEHAADAQAAATATAIGSAARPPTSPPAPVPAAQAAKPSSAPLQRKTSISGNRMDVSVVQDGEILGEVDAEINLPNLLATVFTNTRRDKGEVPFAIDQQGGLYTQTQADRGVITALHTSAVQAATPPGTLVLPDWVVVTTADPSGSALKFGIARPLGGALDDLRRSSARNAGLGLGLIALALVGIVPLSSRLTRNLTRLSEGVNRIASGDYQARVDVSSNDEMGRLASAFNRMAADVERHQRSAVEQERIRRELELGRQIQHDMLPHTPLTFGLTEIRGRSVPANEVGGDFFNYFQTASGQLALIVGDVSGKGVGAALLMANIQASLRTRLALGQDLASLARELDADVGANTPDDVFATLFVGLLSPDSRSLDYVNAGHNPPFVVRAAGGLEHMGSSGLPIGLGIEPPVGYEPVVSRIDLSAGDWLFFYTDGCVEAENSSGEMFGADRLEQLITTRRAGPADDVLAQVEREIRHFCAGREPVDDATTMLVTIG